MLKAKWISKKINYSGAELRSLFAYLDHGVLGDSVVAFRGSCDVSFDHMVDGEDLLEKSEIAGSDMVHFIFEIFDRPLFAGVLLQRLFASIVIDVLSELGGDRSVVGDVRGGRSAGGGAGKKAAEKFSRSGDDVYLGKKKFSISIATRSPNSTMIHFAVNVSNEGTPVETCCLKDFGIDPKKFAETCLKAVQEEYDSVVQATYKVKAVN